MFFFVKIAFALLSFKRKAVQFCCLPPHGGSGLKSLRSFWAYITFQSPSTRREWIEISSSAFTSATFGSPSTRREWIEIGKGQFFTPYSVSPSTRREWIEIRVKKCVSANFTGLPPHGGSGLKSAESMRPKSLRRSPSTRREWIEIGDPRLQIEGCRVSLHTEGVD